MLFAIKINFRGCLSHLFTDDVIQIWNTDICFHQRDLIHLLREGSLLYIVLDPHSVVGCWATLRNKHLLCRGENRQGAAVSDTEAGMKSIQSPAG